MRILASGALSRLTAGRAGAALFQLALVIATIALIDVLGYLLLPDTIGRQFLGYRMPGGLSDGASGGHRNVPRDYYAAHPTRGFDIKAGHKAQHVVQGLRYPIWGNALGCFDREWPEVPKGYTYFAGDSFTWGYAPFETKFATLFEKQTGRPSLKCGVEHTGQLHQLDKLRDVIGKVGHAPKRVVLGYFVNDVPNDYAHPHSTVVSGWLVDDVLLDPNYERVRVDKPWLEQRISRSLAESAVADAGLLSSLKDVARRYSLSSHLLNSAWHGASQLVRGSPAAGSVDEGWQDYNGRRVRSLYYLPHLDQKAPAQRFKDNRFAEPNRKALQAWREHALANGYRLTILLIPPYEYPTSVDFYKDLKQFLAGNGIEFIDVAEEFRRLRTTAAVAYWIYDGHLSIEGNRIVADLLVTRLRD